MYFIGSEACRGANRFIVGVFDVREVCIPVILVFVADHGQRLCHGVIYAFDSPLPARVVGACREFVYTPRSLETAVAICAQN